MTDNGYRKRLAADLPKWLDAGWVTTEGATRILGSVGGERRTAFGLAAILGTLGALLLGLGVVAFVGANWEETPRLFRLALILAAMVVAYTAAFAFDRRDLRIFAEAGLLAAGLVYAGAIVLVGQTYHMAGDFQGAVLLFEAGILAAALFTGSPTMTVLALAAAGYWGWSATVDNGVVPHWASLAAILIGVAIATVQNSHWGRIVAVIAAMYWLGLTIAGFGDAGDWSFAAGMMVYATSALAIWSVGASLAAFTRMPRLDALGEAMLWPGLLATLIAFGLLQFAETASVGEQPALIAALTALAVAVGGAALAYMQKGATVADIVAVAILGIGAVGYAVAVPDDALSQRLAGGILVIVAALWAVSLGQSGKHPIGKLVGLAAFGVEIIYLYVRTLGTILDTAIAFLVGGLLFVALAFLLYRVDRMLARQKVDAAVAVVQAGPAAPVTASSLPSSEIAAEPTEPAYEADATPPLPTPPSPPAGEGETR